MNTVITMPSCPTCNFEKGLWSKLNEKEGKFVCSINPAHTFKKDEHGYFHSI